eukprot:Ihof_evm4s327 gene=Ihof_evmTU4s327
MGRLLKKGTRGSAIAFISRTQALRKLQLSLPDFRRLCILKGIFPREPNNTRKLKSGPTATYYYTKDIKFLTHEPLLEKFRGFKSFIKKLKKAVAKRDNKTALKLEENAPVYSVDHLVKERYPTFVDAIRDLDDALCMVFLFRAMPRSTKVKSEFVDQCERLVKEFMNFVVINGALRKTFLSIKGIYYQAEIMGQTVNWIVPYSFSQKVPEDVDFRVMLTFLEFYTTMLGFVNFKLYHSINLVYPPRLDANSDSIGGGLRALVMEQKDNTLRIAVKDDTPVEEEKASDEEEEEEDNEEERKERMATLSTVLHTIKDEGADEDAPAANDEPVLDSFVAAAPGGDELNSLQEAMDKEKENTLYKTLFSECNFFLSREVPYESLEFVIRSLGGKVSWYGLSELTKDACEENDASITHMVVDRPNPSKDHPGRLYVQPQWIYDCINARSVLNADEYAPGDMLPPHLSPFVEVREGDYDPSQPKRQPEEDDEEVEVDSDSEELHKQEMEAEAKGIAFSQKKNEKKKTAVKKTKTEKEEEEAKELAKTMMSKKHLNLYNKIKYGQKAKAEE